VLAVYNWPKTSERYRKVERFTQRLFANFEKLQKPPYHPKWKDVNVAATVPGWTRFAVAESELQQLKRARGLTEASVDLEQEFRAFVGNLPPRDGLSRNREDLHALFQEFMEWRNRQGGKPR
jgi:hypothetical protein